MANVLKAPVWRLDTIGVVSESSLYIKAIHVFPNAAGDGATLSYWDTQTAVTSSHIATTATAATGTITAANGTSYTAALFPALDVVKINSSDGLAANIGHNYLIGTAGNNSRFIVTPTAAWADEATVYYETTTYTTYNVLNALTQATNKMDGFYWFGDKGIFVPNLALTVISTSAVVYLYPAF